MNLGHGSKLAHFVRTNNSEENFFRIVDAGPVITKKSRGPPVGGLIWTRSKSFQILLEHFMDSLTLTS